MVQVRKAKIVDLETLVRLEAELRDNQFDMLLGFRPQAKSIVEFKPDIEDMVGDYCRRLIYSSRGLVLIAEENGKAVGYLIMAIRKAIPLFDVEVLAELMDLYVREGHRGQGIATMMKDIAFEWAKSKGAECITLDTIPNNEHAKSIYEHWGMFPFMINLRMDIRDH